MLTLNLVNQDFSDINYKISKFPDGQQSITIGDYHIEEADGVIEGFVNS
jgi:hypothetical protein